MRGLILLFLFTLLISAFTARWVILPYPAHAQNNRGFVTVSGKDFLLNGKIFKVKGCNLSTPNYNWAIDLYQTVPNENVEKQLLEAKKFNINVIRLEASYIGLGKDQVTEEKRDLLRYYLNLVGESDLKIIVSFFPDQPYFAEIKDPASRELHKKHLSGIIPYFKDDPRIFAWEVANELLNPVADSKEDQLIMIAWAKEMVNTIRTLDNNHLVTVGGAADWTYTLHPEFSEFIDFVPVHYYPGYFYPGIPERLPDYLDSQIKAIRQSYPQPILIEEVGIPTWTSGPELTTEELYQTQSKFYERICQEVEKNQDITGMIQWSIQDGNFNPVIEHPPDDYHYQWGLIKSDFSWKPAASVFRDCDIGQCHLRSKADTNCDNRIDSEDFSLLVEDYLREPVHNTDFNSDGRVDSEDFAILQANYLK